jgi:hypothetical protein
VAAETNVTLDEQISQDEVADFQAPRAVRISTFRWPLVMEKTA